MIWAFVGTFAALCIALGYIPQIVKGLRTKEMDDVSLGMFLLLLSGNISWLLYGIHLGDFIIIGANVFNISFGLTTISLKVKYSKTL